MKLNHFAFFFIIIAITIVIYSDIRTNNLKIVIDNKEQIDRNIDSAIDDGAAKLVEIDLENNLSVSKEKAASSFFMSLYSSFDLLSDKKSQEKLNLYIPVITVMEDDGYYIFFSDEYNSADGYTYIAKHWSEKYPYYYEDPDFVYSFTLGDMITIFDKNNILGGGQEQSVYSMDYHNVQIDSRFAAFRTLRPSSILLNDEAFGLVRKGAIIKSLEESMSYYASHHNNIASRYGITYNFHLPVMKEDEWAARIDNVGIMVIFQGYPYGSLPEETYNRVASAGAKISKSEVYYIEQKGWYLIYHKDTCPELLKEGIILREEPEYDPLACISKGSYSCPVCRPPYGAEAPDYALMSDR